MPQRNVHTEERYICSVAVSQRLLTKEGIYLQCCSVPAKIDEGRDLPAVLQCPSECWQLRGFTCSVAVLTCPRKWRKRCTCNGAVSQRRAVPALLQCPRMWWRGKRFSCRVAVSQKWQSRGTCNATVSQSKLYMVLHNQYALLENNPANAQCCTGKILFSKLSLVLLQFVWARTTLRILTKKRWCRWCCYCTVVCGIP